MVIRAWRDWTNGVQGWAGGGGKKGGEKKKKGMKSIFRMNGLFWGESARRRGRKWNREKKRGGEGDGKQEECYTISN